MLAHHAIESPIALASNEIDRTGTDDLRIQDGDPSKGSFIEDAAFLMDDMGEFPCLHSKP